MPQESELHNLAEQLADPEMQEFALDAEGNILEKEASATCPDKPNTGNRKLRAQFGRKRTHNEQIIVAPCGVIIARATLYGAEAITSVMVCFTKFPHIDANSCIGIP